MAYATKRIIRNGIIALCDNGGEVFKIDLETRRYAVARNITDDSVKAEINRELERVGMETIFKVKAVEQNSTRRKGWKRW